MITKKITKLKMEEKEAEKAYKHKDTFYDKEKGELILTINKASGKAFRLVHDGNEAFIIEGDEKTVTETIHEVEEFNTEKQVLKRIAKLGLKYDPPEVAP